MGRKVEAGKPATAPVQAGTAERSEARRGGGNERAEVLFRKRSPRDWVTGSEQGGQPGAPLWLGDGGRLRMRLRPSSRPALPAAVRAPAHPVPMPPGASGSFPTPSL